MYAFLPALPYSALDPSGLPSIDAVQERGRAAIVPLVLAAAGGDPAAREPHPPWTKDRLETALQQALVSELGAWAEGVFWNATEGGGGGPVRGYCCPRCSLFSEGDEGIATSIERVLASLVDWRTFLEVLAARFGALRASTLTAGVEERFIAAATDLLPLVLTRTEASDAWYRTFASVLCWFADFCGDVPEIVHPVIHDTISGRFESWVEPPIALAGQTVRALGVLVAAAAEASTPEAVDGLAAWATIRNGPALLHEPDVVPAAWDGHRRFVEGAEAVRDRARAERMSAALEACRRSAHAREPLTFDRLAGWQSLVLGEQASFRETDAFAKKGRERYGLDEQTRPRFERWLAEANDETIPLATRAAKVYLDVCFVHPFADGNARSARLALDYVLTRGGYWLRTAEPLFRLALSPSDTDTLRSLAWSVSFSMGRIPD